MCLCHFYILKLSSPQEVLFDLSTPIIWELVVKKYPVEQFLKSNPRSVSKYLTNIISYRTSVDSSTWHSHVMIFVELNSNGQKMTLNLCSVVKFPACVYHFSAKSFFFLNFDVPLPIIIEEPTPLSNKIQK